MLRIVNIALLVLTCSVLPAWAQTDAPEMRSAPPQRGTRTTPPTGFGNPSRQSDTSTLPSSTFEAPQSRKAAASPIVIEPVPIIPTKEGENGHIRTVCHLGFIPAKNAAETLIKIFKTEGESMPEPVKNKVVIVPEVLSNCLIVTGPPAAVDEVRRLVNEMDRPAPIVRLEVQLTEEKEPLMQAELSTLDNQEAYIQFGQQESLISGVSMNNVGASHALTPVQVGTIIQMTPRVATGGKVSVYFNIQDSRLGPQEEGTVVVTPKDGQPIRTPNIETLSNQTTLQLQDGQTQTISAITRNGKARRIAVTAHIIHPGAENITK